MCIINFIIIFMEVGGESLAIRDDAPRLLESRISLNPAYLSQVAEQHDTQTFPFIGQEEDTDGMAFAGGPTAFSGEVAQTLVSSRGGL